MRGSGRSASLMAHEQHKAYHVWNLADGALDERIATRKVLHRAPSAHQLFPFFRVHEKENGEHSRPLQGVKESR